jgi:hypothetical protein
MFNQGYHSGNQDYTQPVGAIRGWKTGNSDAYGGGLQFLYQPDQAALGILVGMTMTGAGKFIIGDTASHTSDLLQIETPASGGGHGIQIRRNDANNNQSVGHILFGNNIATDLVKISAKTDGDGNSGDSGALLFSTQVTNGDLTERMRIDSSGNVGIGEPNPDAPLHITSNTPTISFDETDASQEYRIGSFGGAFAIHDTTDSAYRFVLDGDGKVGIGTTGPADELSVTGTVNATDFQCATGSSCLGTDVIDDIYLFNTGDTATGNYTFDTDTFFIDSSSDRIGVNTTTPQNTLNVLGDLNVTNIAYIGGAQVFVSGGDMIFKI